MIMQPKLLKTVFTGLFLVLVVTFLAYQRSHKPRIFILHSYHQKLPWVQSLNRGIAEVFGDKAYVNLRYFYMDTKSLHPNRYLERLNTTITKAISAWEPDIIIAFDYDAHNLVRNKFANNPKIKLVLAGVTDSKRWAEYEDTPNITGITEQVPVNVIREILSLIFPSKKRIYYLSDDSASARELDEEISKEDWSPFELTRHRVKTFVEWKAAVFRAAQSADILLVSTFYTITDGSQQIPAAQLIGWMNQNSRIPAVGMYESYIINGGMIAVAKSGREQGHTAAWLALNILEKKMAIQNIPLIHGKTFSFFVNKAMMQKKFPKIHIPEILDALSKIHKLGD
jgi:ABC-type uncharacterized transport system substrate-binding protein